AVGGLVRYDTHGGSDPTFGTNGIATTTIQGGWTPVGVIQQTSGKLVLAGTSVFAGEERFVLVRFSADGALDATFGDGGVVSTPNTGEANVFAQQRDGKLLVGGAAPGASVIVRYDAEGVLDAGFGSGGRVFGSLRAVY